MRKDLFIKAPVINQFKQKHNQQAHQERFGGQKHIEPKTRHKFRQSQRKGGKQRDQVNNFIEWINNHKKQGKD